LSLWENFYAVIGAASDAKDLASQVSTEAQDGARSSYLVTDCLLGKEIFEENFSLRGIDSRRSGFEEWRLGRQLTHFKSADGDIRPSGIGIEKGIESGYRCSKVGILRQKDGHVRDDKLRHGADAEKAEFFRLEVNTPTSDLERLQAVGGDLERDRETFDFKIANDARAHEIELRAVCIYGEEE
jgi:hypothetical protein